MRRITRPGLSAEQVDALLSTKGYATTTDVSDAISDLVNSSPEALDTLYELAAALGDDPSFAENVLEAIGERVPKDEGVVVVNHGATAGTTRPEDAAVVYWIGSVEPTNAENADLWYDTTGDA